MSTRTAAVLALPGDAFFALAVACEAFGRAGRYELLVAGACGPAGPGEPLSLQPANGLAALARADTIVVPGRRAAADVVEAIRDASGRGARILAFGTGSFALGAAGLLGGRRVTTDWAFADELQRLHPSAHVDRRALYIDDGDILTSGGSGASIDLALHVVRTDFGVDVANRVAREMVVPPRRPLTQAPFLEPNDEPSLDDDRMRRVLASVVANLDEPVSVAELATRCGMTPRTFARRFVTMVGATPMQWLQAQRLALARRLLESTDEPIDEVARRCGLGPGGLRHRFARDVSISPAAYRRAFSSPALRSPQPPRPPVPQARSNASTRRGHA